MSETGGREQVFQLGVKYIENILDDEFRKKFSIMLWNEETKELILSFFKKKYRELKTAMPFLGIEEYPKMAFFVESEKLKIHLQGWLHNCEQCWLLGGMWFNRKQYYDFYLCEKNYDGGIINSKYLLIKYGDQPSQRYLRKVIDNFNYGVKWRAINGLYRRFGEILSINPAELLNEGKE